MQARKRYILLIVSCAFLAYCYFGGFRLKASSEDSESRRLVEFASVTDRTERLHVPMRLRPIKSSSCRMETCFDYSRCGHDPKVYIYPPEGQVSPTYRKILSALRDSKYVTDDPRNACLLVPAVDTLDGDPLSPEHSRDAAAKLKRLPFWNNGRNHLIFNLYAGTWPDYAEEELGFDPGEAILARASASERTFRDGFDVSLPLFHRQHPERGGAPPAATSNIFPAPRRHVLAFKGKRYVHGIGSETRNSLWHLHDGNDIVLVTTCKHGKSWREMKDERCDEDNKEYDRYDYEQLLSNSTFCLVARGRRLGSYRFLEALSSGCIPVLLSNKWRLPFDETVDWRRAAIWADERLLLQVPELVRSVPPERVLSLRQQTQILWQQYFSSVEKMVYTTIEIILERVLWHRGVARRSYHAWNTSPGALHTLQTYGDSPHHYPFAPILRASAATEYIPTSPSPLVSPTNVKKQSPPPITPGSGYTALIYAQTAGPVLNKLLRSIAAGQFVEKIVLVWDSSRAAPGLTRLRRTATNRTGSLAVVIVDAATHYPGEGLAARFKPLWAIETAAVFSLDGDVTIGTEELDFAFKVWQHFPERIVGYPARDHYWDESKNSWGYSSRWSNTYSLVLAGAALVHRYWLALYAGLTPALHASVAHASNCEDILLNCLVAHVTRRPPIKLTQRKAYLTPPKQIYNHRSSWWSPEHFVQRQSCLNTFAAVWGYMPLERSILRLDPLLFKDPVSNLRKKYRQLESAPS